MDQRGLYCGEGVAVSDENEQFRAAVAAPILCGGDVLGAVLFSLPTASRRGRRSVSLPRPWRPFWASTWSPDKGPAAFTVEPCITAFASFLTGLKKRSA